MKTNIKNNIKMSSMMPWIDEWIEESDNLSSFSSKESEIFQTISINWNLRDRIELLNELIEEHGDVVKSVLRKLIRERTIEDWKSIARDIKDNSLDAFIGTLWKPLRNEGFEYSMDIGEYSAKIECRKCPIADMAKEINGNEWIFELACMSDYYMVEGFNPEIKFKRSKTIVEGDEICNHLYRQNMKIEEHRENHSIKEITYIDKQSVEDFLDEIKDIYSQDDLLNAQENYNDKGGLFFVGKLNSTIIAMCGFVPISEDTVELRRFRVRKDLRGLGYGTDLLEHVEMYIKKMGYTNIKLSTAASRENTLQFYLKRDYSEISREMYGKIETVIFSKEI